MLASGPVVPGFCLPQALVQVQEDVTCGTIATWNGCESVSENVLVPALYGAGAQATAMLGV